MAKRKSRRDDDDFDFYGYFPPSRPIRTEGGIQSRSQRGAFAATWWAKRWLAVLESYGIGSRLQRGRSYARSGQVLNINVQPGRVESRVQGSRPRPYDVEIKVKLLSDAEWARVLNSISQQAIFAAQLLDGVMPQEIESAFKAAHVSLFPANQSDLVTDCSCPDYSNPCKHIAAVYYLLGEQFDRDPFLIFLLRGRTREQVIQALRDRRAAAADEVAEGEPSVETLPAVVSLDEQLAEFWGTDTLNWTPPPIAAPEINGAVLKRLGTPPGDLKTPLEAVYQAMTEYVQAKIGDDKTQDQSPN
jgi:uncharacterized Zn finger protein